MLQGKMDRLNDMMNQRGFPLLGGRQTRMGEQPQVDNSEIIYISPLSLLKVYSFTASMMANERRCSNMLGRACRWK